MFIKNLKNYYPRSIRIIHWLNFILILLGVLFVVLRDEIEGKALRFELLNLHRELGVMIFFLLCIRVFFRVKHLNNTPDHGLPLLAAVASKITHAFMYISLFLLPVLGLLQTNASGKEAHFFGLFELPRLIGENEGLAETLQDYHAYAAWILVAIIGIHATAALWHHFILKDGVLVSMKIHFRNKKITTTKKEV